MLIQLYCISTFPLLITVFVIFVCLFFLSPHPECKICCWLSKLHFYRIRGGTVYLEFRNGGIFMCSDAIDSNMNVLKIPFFPHVFMV